MTSENIRAQADITPASIDAVVHQARAERAEAMSAILAALPATLKRLVASIRASRLRLPQKGAWA